MASDTDFMLFIGVHPFSNQTGKFAPHLTHQPVFSHPNSYTH